MNEFCSRGSEMTFRLGFLCRYRLYYAPSDAWLLVCSYCMQLSCSALERHAWSACLVLCLFRLRPSRLTLAGGVSPDGECGQLPPGALPL